MTQEQHWRAADTASMLTAPDENSHKYSRGVLGVRTGSNAYPGAAVLTVEAAWRTGVGLVQYTPPRDDRPNVFGLPTPAAAILAQRPETVFAPDNTVSRDRCDAWVLGSGTNPEHRSEAEHEVLAEILQGEAPVVIDAGALNLVAQLELSAPTVITPHTGEFRTLWQQASLSPSLLENMSREQATAKLAQELRTTVLLKGSTTIAASPEGEIFIYGPATPWLATAGTGDVLAGILGSLVATHADRVRQQSGLLARLAVTAAALHDAAARIACDEDSGHAMPITALDVAKCIPQAHRTLRAL